MPRISLAKLGFTELESDVYVALLTHGDMTGYAVAKELGKAVANVYKSLDSLGEKGAVAQAQDGKASFSAVPWQQLLANEDRKFTTYLEELSAQLQSLPEATHDEKVYQLQNVDQVIADGIRMIDAAQFIVLCDVEPDAVIHFAAALERAAARGVEVRVKVYEEVTLAGVQLVKRSNGAEVYARTEDVRFEISADGKHMLTALFNANQTRVVQAFRTGSALINMSIYSGLVYEFILTELKPAIANSDLALAQDVLRNYAHLHPFSTRNQVFEVFETRYRAERAKKDSQ